MMGDPNFPPEKPAFKPLRPFVRVILVGVGTIALALGVVGIILPILPTTPFLILAAGCYLRSSERMFRWLTNHPRLGQRVRLYIDRKGIPLKVKVISLVIAWTVLGATALFIVDNVWLKGLLLCIAIAKTIFMARIRTLVDEADSASDGCPGLQLD